MHSLLPPGAMRACLSHVLACLSLLSVTSSCARRQVIGLSQSLLQKRTGETAERAMHGSKADELRIDQLQLKGSHNSYHRAPRLALTRRFRYSHASLARQLSSLGVRHLELDVRYTPHGLRVAHAPIIDGRTSCSSFLRCIQEVRSWSLATPRHVPVFVFVQPKDGLVGAGLDGRLALLDSTIARVFPRDALLVPRDVARDFPSLRAAVHARGWPTLEATRGKVAFVLFGHPRLVRQYAGGRARLDGRLMFAATGHSGAPFAAVLSVDDPERHYAEIVSAVREHLLVRTRADAGLVRRGARRDAAITSGAHFIGSDFINPADLWLDLGPGAPARQNPRTAHAERRPVLEEAPVTEQALSAR